MSATDSICIDLASARLGGEAVAANDEFFAEKENLLKPEPAVFIPDKYTDRGKWMDGWETRRRRTPGHDWCIVALGLPGIIHAVVVDTAFFRGNYPSHCWIDGCGLPAGADPTGRRRRVASDPRAHRADRRHQEHRSPCRHRHAASGASRTCGSTSFPTAASRGCACMGEALPDWTRILAGRRRIDLAAAAHGGYVVDTSDRFFGEPRNMLMPYPAANMGDGWETKRRRGPGHDWAVIHLGAAGHHHAARARHRALQGQLSGHAPASRRR